jgi:hypothetical protein
MIVDVGGGGDGGDGGDGAFAVGGAFTADMAVKAPSTEKQ